MKRRSFLQMLGLAPAAAVIATEVIAEPRELARTLERDPEPPVVAYAPDDFQAVSMGYWSECTMVDVPMLRTEYVRAPPERYGSVSYITAPANTPRRRRKS